MADLRSINGSNALIRVVPSDGIEKTVGYATGVSVTESIALNRIDVLGQIDSKDIEPIGRIVSGTIGLMRMTTKETEGGGAGKQKLTPLHTENATAIDRTKDVMDFMETGFDLIIQDSAVFEDSEAKVRYRVVGCRPSSHSFALSRGMLMGVDVTFEALKLVEQN